MAVNAGDRMRYQHPCFAVWHLIDSLKAG